MSAPLRVGVVIPAYQAEATVAVAIASVVAQSHKDWAIVVVDDGSTDGTAAHVPTGEPRVRLLRQPNGGVSAARNAGLAALPPVDAVLFLDADDWLAADALARMAAALAACSAETVAVAAPHAVVDEDGRVVRVRPVPFRAGDIRRRLMVRNLFVNGGHCMIRAGAAAASGGFRTDLRFGEDWEYWTRLAARGPFGVAPGRGPVLFARSRAEGAYCRLVRDPDAVRRCLDAIHPPPSRLRARAETEMAWTVGREELRAGLTSSALGRLRRAWLRAPSGRRLALLLYAHAMRRAPVR